MNICDGDNDKVAIRLQRFVCGKKDEEFEMAHWLQDPEHCCHVHVFFFSFIICIELDFRFAVIVKEFITITPLLNLVVHLLTIIAAW